MKDFHISIDINAPIEQVWAETIDIERWPEWTPTVRKARRLDTGPLVPGSKVRLHQPGLPPSIWVLEAIEPGRSITLRSGIPGMRVHAHHLLAPRAGGGCSVTLMVRFSGLLGGVLARGTRELNNRYLALEAKGLKQRCEGASR